MASARHTLLLPLLLLAAATMAALAVSGGATAASELMMSTIHARVAAEWAWSSAAGAASSSSSDDSCWGSPEECPVVYDVDAEGGGAAAPRARMRLQLYDDVNAAASLLPTAQYLSYSVLMPDTVPCSVPGMSYYNCQPGADANPYTRGCSAITQCRD
jgi:hypothetical protein